MPVPCHIRDSASQLFYQDHQSPQYQALLTITELPHPDRSILGAFLIDAQDPQEAARYFLRETAIGGTSQSAPTKAISEFLSNWKYLVNLCKYNIRLSKQVELNLSLTCERVVRPIVATSLSAETKRLSLEDYDLRFVHIVPPRVLMNPDLVEGGLDGIHPVGPLLGLAADGETR
ncbi:hypothetical protein N7530_012205 [Penicillium desertorum]|uniref:Uncharacterized protein n=1 Tax=Penicillium desertorum TaxID=1303715 RepID=A0A9W9WEU9_9EURO|nr:hypothetical protein N7530_012205 [Penicillium desertorum]